MTPYTEWHARAYWSSFIPRTPSQVEWERARQDRQVSMLHRYKAKRLVKKSLELVAQTREIVRAHK